MQALTVAEDRCERAQFAQPLEAHRDVALLGGASTAKLVPRFRVTDVVDTHVVVRAPEERHLLEAFPSTEDVARSRLSHSLRDDPVLDADALPAMGIGPTCNVARGVDAARARLEEFIHRNAAIERKTGIFREREPGSHANTDDHQRGIETRAVIEHHGRFFNPCRLAPEVKDDALLTVQRLDERAKLTAEHTLQRHSFRAHHVDVESTCAE